MRVSSGQVTAVDGDCRAGDEACLRLGQVGNEVSNLRVLPDAAERDQGAHHRHESAFGHCVYGCPWEARALGRDAAGGDDAAPHSTVSPLAVGLADC